MKVKVHFHQKSVQKAVRLPSYKRSIIINKKMVLTVHDQESIFLNKPFIVGQTILDLSKVHMMSFWYNEILTKVSHDKIRMLFTDTDSFCFTVNDPNFDLNQLNGMDFSNYPENHPWRNKKTENVTGLVSNIFLKGKNVIRSN